MCLSEGSSSRFEEHQAVECLSASLDLKHACGFITLLKTGKTYQTPSTKQQVTSNTASPSEVKSTKDSTNTAVSSSTSTRSHSCSPKNGIQDSLCAKVLASELDSLDQDLDVDSPISHKATTDRTNLKLDLDTSSVLGKSDDLPVGTCNRLESHWLLLDCCYGVPLFDAHVNRQVCDRILAQGLCNRDRYISMHITYNATSIICESPT